MATCVSARSILCAATAITFGSMAAPAADDPPLELPQFFVAGQRVAALEIPVPRGDLRPPEPNLGQELLAIPGVYSHARAADAMEPSLRGLGFDRVATTIDGIPLVNASPERTNSPVVILGGSAVTGITVYKVLPSVTLGPATTGGYIALNTDGGRTSVSAAAATERRPLTDGGTAADSTAGGMFNATYNGARDGLTLMGRATTFVDGWDASATFFRNDLHDYAAADGQHVPAEFQDLGGSVGVGWHDGNQRARLEVLSRRLIREETVSLPLDGKNTDSQVFTFDYRWSNPTAGSLASVAWRIGYATTDPYITSEDRLSPSLIFAHATARSFGSGVDTKWQLSASDTLDTGADSAVQTRRAIRTTAAGNDYIWPDAHFMDTGLFAEWSHVFSAEWKLRLGVRGDDVHSRADAVDKPALGKPIRDQYVLYNGPAAAQTERSDQVGAANLLLDWTPTHVVSTFAGVGYTEQTAGVMERYRAFLNALGGDGHGGNAVELGNPALRPERKSALEAGATLHGTTVDLEATAFWYRVDDFILREPIGFTQPPLARMVVFGYRNIDAEFWGTEFAATLKPGGNWMVPLSLAAAEARNTATGAGLSEIPPIEANAAARYRGTAAGRPVALELGGRFVFSKDNPAPLENPLFANTGGFALWHVRGGFSPSSRLKLEAGIENLFNHGYTEYLSPPVAPIRPASGDLLPGDRVPGPGRSAWVSLTLTW